MPKEERAQREWHMSQYERRRRGNALPGDGSRLPSGGNTRAGRRGSGHLAVSLGYLGGRLDKTGDTQMTALGDEAVGKPGVAGVYTNQRLSLSTTWEGPRLICRGFKPDPGNLAVRECVQESLVCSAGDRPAGAKVRSPVVWMAGRRETKILKPIDKDSRGETTSRRAVIKVNALWPRKVKGPRAEPAPVGRRQHGVPKSD